MDKNVRVRFAPSPTGMLHLGGARTAIYNWAFARAVDGTFILRIEDTDPERSTEENTQIILRALRWLGLDWDEGPEVGGPCGPYFQSERASVYSTTLERLKELGAVYPCFCTKEELAEERKAAIKAHGGYDGYSGKCRNIDAQEAARRIAAGEEHVWRLKVPADHGPIEFDDAVYGHMSFPGDSIDDIILVRADGTPTYNFSNVCDDVDMGITHVIRGDDHLSNTPKQVLIYEALNETPPVFAHLPMILGTDGKKLSKRHGATNVEEYRDRGYLPEAMVNYLALLGWSLDGDTTIISPDRICETFSLDRISKKDSVFDTVKLDWMNGVYIREVEPDKWFYEATPWLAESYAHGSEVPEGVTIVPTLTKEELKEAAEQTSLPGVDIDEEKWQASLARVQDDKVWFMRTRELIVERMNRFDEISAKLEYLFWGSNLKLDQKSLDKVLLKDREAALESLSICRGVLADTTNPWEAQPLEETCRAIGDERNIKPKNLFQPLRVAVCGNMVSPPLFESIELLDRDEVLARIDLVVEFVEQNG